ncbi:proline transporter, YAT family [Metschnikowia aff. pulcherrima]|uniref:Proline transporter, YAT family n=1 Tax=Metschnikowia aff. pulcherrima TaxID=2163413 RepID=A0A4P6XLD3_9ASCO|nr:proline transporter, YAT family [Metschnikowia aff. pulcherrima]
MVDLKPLTSRPSIYRSNSAYVDFEITNSKIVNVDEKGHIVSENNSIVSFNEEVLQKGLKNRHIQLIALGGAIGTGLFVGSGFALYTCGPAALFLSYIILSLVVWFVMNMMAEMATFLPVPGAGAQQFISDYTDPSIGFALGYNYWYGFTFLVAAEVVAAALIIQYWTTKVHIAVWISVFLALALIVNLCPVKAYGEVEFYFAGIKLIAITGLIILGVVLFFGGGPDHDRLGFRYWKNGNAFHHHLVGGNTGHFLSVWTAIIKAGYSFIMSPELIVACSGETSNPRKALPRCANQFVYRLAFFYILGSLVIGVIANSRSETLASSSSNASASPFVLGIQNAGIPVLNHIINAVVLTSAASAGNSFFYASTRTLYSLSKKGLAPKIFSTVNRFGVPYYCVAITFIVSCLSYLNVSSSSTEVFTWFSNLTTISGFVSWIFVAIAFLRWRKGIVAQQLEDRVPYKTRFQPFGAYFVIIFIGLITITNGYAVFFDFNAADFVAAYITLPIVVFLYVGHRSYSYFYLGRKRWLTPPEEFDFSKLELVEYEHSQIVEPERKKIFRNVFKSSV